MKIGANQAEITPQVADPAIKDAGKTTDLRKVTRHNVKPVLLSRMSSGLKSLSDYKISSAVNARVNTIKPADTPGAKVVATARNMVGRYHWGPPAMNVDGAPNGLEDLVKRGTPISEQSRLNCWESVLQSGMKSGALPADKLVKWMKDNSAMDSDFGYTEKITELFGMEASLPIQDTVPEPGDIILFYGNSHVALSMGGDQMLHLPNNGVFEERSITGFIDSVKKDDRQYAAFLKNGAETICDVSDQEVNEEIYDKLCDFSEATRDLKSGNISRGRYALAKSEALNAFSGIESQLGVRVIKNPWGKMADLFDQPVERP